MEFQVLYPGSDRSLTAPVPLGRLRNSRAFSFLIFAALALILEACSGTPKWVSKGGGYMSELDNKAFYGVGAVTGMPTALSTCSPWDAWAGIPPPAPTSRAAPPPGSPSLRSSAASSATWPGRSTGFSCRPQRHFCVQLSRTGPPHLPRRPLDKP